MIKNIFTGFLIFFLLISSTMIPAIRTENKQQTYPLAEETIGVQWSRQYGASEPDHFNCVRKTTD
ncbi:MAG: hypothetical protein JW840_01725, partial [Candidatus Thermoplasmatota archaeon]|nr:hypothetical protein [Candidatus Thermoplasmatota archaeon]